MEGDGAAGRGGQLGEGLAGDEAGWPIGAKGGWHGRRSGWMASGDLHVAFLYI